MSNPILLPIPKKVRWKEGSFSFGKEISVYTDTAFSEDFVRVYKALTAFTEKDVKLVDADKADVLFLAKTEYGEEEHDILVETDKITIRASKSVGAFRAITTLKQIYRQLDKICCLEIYDKPDLANRATMHDFRGRIMTKQGLMELVDLLVDMKYNQLQLYFETFAFYYEGFPEIFDDGLPVLTPDDIRELDAYCIERYVELVPSQGSFGHLSTWLRRPEFKDLGIPEEGGGGSINPLDPRSMELVEKIYDCLIPCFSSDKVHICFDEVVELGTGKTAEAAAEHGKGKLFIDHFMKVYNLVTKKYGKKVMFWEDMMREFPELFDELPDDAMAMLWCYNAYDRLFDQYAPMLKEYGKKFYVCPGTGDWAAFTGRSECTLKNIQASAEVAVQYDNCEGMLLTSWGNYGGPYLEPIRYFGFAVAATYAWNGDPNVCREYDEDRSKFKMADIWVDSFITHTIHYNSIDYIGKVMLKCDNVNLGDVLYRMGMYRYLECEDVGDSTKATEIFASGFGGNGINMPRDVMKKINPVYFENAAEYMEKILRELDTAKTDDPATLLAIREMKCNTKMVIYMEYALYLQYYYLNDTMTAEHIEKAHAVADGIYEMVEEFKELWLKRNFEKQLDFPVKKFTDIADKLKSL